MDAIKFVWSCVVDPRATRWVCPLLLLADAALCGVVVWKVAYTNIDWDAYMQQIALYLAGERDYIKIRGDTGPLVYPAAHVYIYRLLYHLTDSGTNLALAQGIFIGLYLSTLALVMQCYRQAGHSSLGTTGIRIWGVPPYLFPLLILSKRVHSIFMLRLFNDCFAVFFLFFAIFCYQRRWWTLGSIAYSVGLGVKMSLLLALPAVGMVLWQGMGRNRALGQAQIMFQLQILLAYPFLTSNARSYFSRAFEFTRQFLFKWTVNWRFVGEETFLSRPFSLTLLTTHASLLYLFGLTRWLAPSNLSLSGALRALISPPPEDIQIPIARRVTPEFTLTAILSSILIGCLCARSLHYQFYVYIAWSTPFLLWRAGLHPVFVYTVFFAQEWAWNVYPSTAASSVVVVACMLVTVASVWFGTSPSWQDGADGATNPRQARTAAPQPHAE